MKDAGRAATCHRALEIAVAARCEPARIKSGFVVNYFGGLEERRRRK